MRLSADMITLAAQFTNALKDRELDLREYKIPIIENLGATLDQFDTIDFTDNEIRVLGGFPQLKRLKTLLLSQNRICRFDAHLFEGVGSLEELNLSNNLIAELGDLKPLAKLAKLSRVCLTGNPVAKLANYRMYLIFLLPELKLLDYNKVKDQERKDAVALFSGASGEALLKKIVKNSTMVDAAKTNASSDANNTSDELNKIKTAIANASTLAEVKALEAQLKAGTLFTNGDAMDTA
eukprot:m.57306 g.57306  ORF g.57306 m.57306 type:complete len:237 (-) comp22363_c1_seq1:251-961(-)